MEPGSLDGLSNSSPSPDTPSSNTVDDVSSPLNSTSPHCNFPSFDHFTPDVLSRRLDPSLGMGGPLQRSQVEYDLIESAFTARSFHSDDYLLSIWERVLSSCLHMRDIFEPKIGTTAADVILRGNSINPSPFNTQFPGESIYRIFVDKSRKICLVCGHKKRSMNRLLGCVRSHLGHRPFRCGGKSDGCSICTEGMEALFFTQALLNDHIDGRTKKQLCIHEDCIRREKRLRRGGMGRHWASVHPDDEFPYKHYRRYN